MTLNKLLFNKVEYFLKKIDKTCIFDLLNIKTLTEYAKT